MKKKIKITYNPTTPRNKKYLILFWCNFLRFFSWLLFFWGGTYLRGHVGSGI